MLGDCWVAMMWWVQRAYEFQVECTNANVSESRNREGIHKLEDKCSICEEKLVKLGEETQKCKFWGVKWDEKILHGMRSWNFRKGKERIVR